MPALFSESRSDAAGKFHHSKIVIDDSGLKKDAGASSSSAASASASASSAAAGDDADASQMTLKSDELELLEILGKGASSYVQKARNVHTGVLMALKVCARKPFTRNCVAFCEYLRVFPRHPASPIAYTHTL